MKATCPKCKKQIEVVERDLEFRAGDQSEGVWVEFDDGNFIRSSWYHKVCARRMAYQILSDCE